MLNWRRTRPCRYGLWLLLVLGCSSLTATDPQPTPIAARPDLKSPKPTTPTLAAALRELEVAHFAQAEQLLRQILAESRQDRPDAELALATLLMTTGEHEQSLALSEPHCKRPSAHQARACQLVAKVLRKQGELDLAIELLQSLPLPSSSRSLRLELAELLAARGATNAAGQLLRQLVLDEPALSVAPSDSATLSISARAAHQLGDFREADRLFAIAERNGIADVQTLLWRAELYLDAHDPNHARQFADEALRLAPNHPSTLVLSARVRASESNPGSYAAKQALQALARDPKRADAYCVLAGLSLRALDYEAVHRYLDRGLEISPNDLELLSLRAAAHFLADESEAQSRVIAKVLALNPDYSRLFRIIAEYAESNHRYEDTRPLLRRAIALNPNDIQVRAELGILLVRAGNEVEGRRELQRAYAQDPFDLRVRNTLVLFERELDHEYTRVKYPQFALRLPLSLREPLEPIFVPWLQTATSELARRYQTANPAPLLVELYANQESFGVRTSGVPTYGLEGVCFGNTLVLRLPTDEPVNLGMTLWHELSHVHHLRLSKHRVPRWFTEGLAEYETERRRPEWKREEELALYEANLQGRALTLETLGSAFALADSLRDLSTAYVAARYFVEFLAETYGFGRMPKLLSAWGEGKTTAEVFARVLGSDLPRLNTGYQRFVARRLAHFDGQYFPLAASPSSATNPSAPLLTLARTQLADRAFAQCRATLAKADRSHPDTLWLESLLLMAESRPEEALAVLDELRLRGNDGYFVRLQRSLLLDLMGRNSEQRLELERAHRFHPTAADPLYRLSALARRENQPTVELQYLDRLCQLEEAAREPHRRRVELHLAIGNTALAWNAAETLSFLDPLSPDSHELIARAALARKDRARARRELRWAIALCTAEDERRRLARWGKEAALE